MKNIVRKFISVLIIISLMFSLGAMSVSATEDNTITQTDIEQALNSDVCNMWNAVLDTPEALGFTDEEVRDAYIGDSFQIIRYDDNEAENVDDIVYLPVISNQEIIALITLIKYDGTISCSIGKDFAPELSDYLNSSNSQVALFSESTSIYGITPSSEVTEVFESPENTARYARVNEPAVSYSDIAYGNNVVSKEELMDETYVIPETLTRAATSYKYLNYPIVFQGNLPICWAATIASMVIFELPQQYPQLYATQVCDKIGHDYTGSTVADNIKALKAYLPNNVYVPTFYDETMIPSEVQVIINNIDPALMGSRSSVGAHATALCGYAWYGSTFQIRLMDPAYECFKFSTYSGGKYKFAFGNTTMEWVDTIRLLYRV